MTGFAAPAFAVGAGDRFRISVSEIAGRSSDFTCPMGLAIRARVRAGSLRIDPPAPSPRFDPTSTLNLAVMRGARAVIGGADPREILRRETGLTHSQRRFLAHALDLLPDVLLDANAAAGVSYRPGDDIVGRVDGNGLHGTVTVWALHLCDPAGTVHEALRLRTGALRTPTAEDLDWTAAAAVALATDGAASPQARIRVSDVSLLDGSVRGAFDGHRADAIAVHASRGQPLWAALNGSTFRPGAACAGCPALRVCPAVPSHAGLLGAAGPVATRKLSASDLASYSRCPTAFRVLRADHLPDRFAPDADPGASESARSRGVAVHAWLAWAHSRRPARPCTEADLPDGIPGAIHGAIPGAAETGTGGPDTVSAAGAPPGLDAGSYAAALPFLRRHVPLCPVGREDLTGWEPEHRWVCHDPQADTVVITTPDLVYRVDGGDATVWRETKTSGSVPPDLAAALRRYPDVALDVVALAAGSAADADPSLVELEVLTPVDAEVFAVSTGDVAAVAEATALVTRIAGAYVADAEFPRSPGPACAGCAAHGWCDPPDDPRRTG